MELMNIYIYIYVLHVKKVKLSLCLTKHHAMKTYWGVEEELHAFLTSILDAVWGVKQTTHPHLVTRSKNECSYTSTPSIRLITLPFTRWDERLASRPCRFPPPPGKKPSVPTVHEDQWAPQPVWTRQRREETEAPKGNRTPVVQPVA
jgi:hypothetical protein